MSRPPLTARQAECLRIVTEGIRAGMPPTIREINAAMGTSSTNAVLCLLRVLVRKGYLEQVPGGKSRATVRLPAPEVSAAWLLDRAQALVSSWNTDYGRIDWTSDDGGQWWRIVAATGGWSDNEALVRGLDPYWEALTQRAQIAGGLWVWAWGPVPEEIGGPLGPVKVEAWT